MALESQGITIFFSTNTVASTAAAAAIEEVNSFTGPSGAAGIIDVTHLLSTAKEKLVGLRDEGQVSLDINFIATGAVQTKLRESRAARTKGNLGIAFSDTAKTIAKMKCYVSGFSITGSVDNKLAGAVTIEITGPVTWTTYT